jgi:uncharacterized protein (TIGR03492 family)
MPSGGFVNRDGRQLLRDLQHGLANLTWSQWQVVRHWADSQPPNGSLVLAVGDLVPLLLARLSGLPYAFVGTAKSDYYLRDETGAWLPETSWQRWFGSDYFPWERWLMGHPCCRAVFPRDSLTASVLRRWSLPVVDAGNPMMDGLGTDWATPKPDRLTLLLLPGSRTPEAFANWTLLLQAVDGVLEHDWQRPVYLLAAIYPSFPTMLFASQLTEHGWQETSVQLEELAEPSGRVFQKQQATLVLTQQFTACLHKIDGAIAMAGTATEQVVGMGKPVITFPGQGPQFTQSFAQLQQRLLGKSVTLVDHPDAVAGAIAHLIHNPELLQQIAANGRLRMGSPGAAQRIANYLIACLTKN